MGPEPTGTVPVTGVAERIAVTAWDQHCAIADEGRPRWGEYADEAAWSPELTEVIDGEIVGDSWSGREWPTGTAQGFLADYHAHPRATHLIMVTTATGVYVNGWRSVLRTLCVVGADGEAFALVAPLHDPAAPPDPLPAVSGDLYIAMVDALRPDHALDDELEQITRGTA